MLKGGVPALRFIASIASNDSRADFAPGLTVGAVIDALQTYARSAAPPVQTLVAALLPPGEHLAMPHHQSDAPAFLANITQVLFLLFAIARPPTPADSASRAGRGVGTKLSPPSLCPSPPPSANRSGTNGCGL
jgi:hypothetical protein